MGNNEPTPIEKKICGGIFFRDQHDSHAIIKMDMTEAKFFTKAHMQEIRRIFPADFATESPKPKYWTPEELSKFEYFMVFTFSIPSVTGGIIFIPLEKISQ